MVLEKTELAACPVNQRVGVDPGLEKPVRVADIDALAVGFGLDAEGFGTAVPQDSLHLERHDHAVPLAVTVGRREVAVDAPADGLSLRPDPDGFRHLQGGVLQDGNGASIFQDALRCACRGGEGTSKKRQAQEPRQQAEAEKASFHRGCPPN
jgi:hypothetical protein